MINQQQTKDIISLISKASHIALKYYWSNDYSVTTKHDNSPVTEVDNIISEMLVTGLQQIVTGIPVISEENKMEANKEVIKANRCFWLVDPIDGTKGFISKDGNFTINAGLISNGTPIFGIISEPLLNETYFTQDGKAYSIKNEIISEITVTQPKEGFRVVTSRRYGNKKPRSSLAHLPITEMLNVSSSYKFCLLAAGRVDSYFHFGPTYTWDTAAGEAIVLAAGGRVLTFDGEKINYDNQTFENTAFCAFNKLGYPLIFNNPIKEAKYE